MTGRKGRVVRDGDGRGVYEARAKEASAEMDSLNVREAGALAECAMPSGQGAHLLSPVPAALSCASHISAVSSRSEQKRCNYSCLRQALNLAHNWFGFRKSMTRV